MRLNTIDSLILLALILTATRAIIHISSQPITERAENALDDVSDLHTGKGGGMGAKGGGLEKGGSSSSGSGGRSGGSASSAGKGSSTSSAGGSTKQGSGVQPSYGGGRYYGGGATTPYRSGATSPLGLPATFLPRSALTYYPGFWPYGAYGYDYYNPYTFCNRSTTNNINKLRSLWMGVIARQDTGVNETKPLRCLCAAYQECGCDDNGNTTFLDSLIGDGSYAALNKTLVDVVDMNGISTIVLNGTLPNGTTIAGGTENANGARRMLAVSRYWFMMTGIGWMAV